MIRSERGAMLVHVSIMLLALLALSAIVIDYGVMWASRGQAQNAADAGALAAGRHMMYNPEDDPGTIEKGQRLAAANAVWLESPAPADVLVYPRINCPPGLGASSGQPGCVKVDVVRGAFDGNGVYHPNTLPMFFGHLVGVTTQGVKATATAEVTSGNAVRCVKPWIVADKWQDNDESGGSWDQDDTYSPGVDTYIAPGFDPTVDTGLELPLKPGENGTWSAGWVMEIDFGCMGSNCYEENIEGCPDWVPTVALYDPEWECDSQNDATSPAHGCLSVKTGVSQGPTSQGVNTLIGLDPNATWNPTGGPDDLGHVDSPCMTANTCMSFEGEHVDISPRIVPIAVFNTGAYVQTSQACSGTGCVAQVVNLMGFFVQGMCIDVYPVQSSRPAYCGVNNADAMKTVLGKLMRYPGQGLNTGGPTTSSFVQMVRLVR
jgi:hypothetical protein